MKNLGQMMKQAQEMQTRMQEMQSALEAVEITGTAGGDMVRVTVTGKGEMKALSVDESLVVPADKEVMEDLVVAAFNDARRKLDAHVQEETSKIMGGLQLPPGMKLPF